VSGCGKTWTRQQPRVKLWMPVCDPEEAMSLASAQGSRGPVAGARMAFAPSCARNTADVLKSQLYVALGDSDDRVRPEAP
jgi:hypothetical protein